MELGPNTHQAQDGHDATASPAGALRRNVEADKCDMRAVILA